MSGVHARFVCVSAECSCRCFKQTPCCRSFTRHLCLSPFRVLPGIRRARTSASELLMLSRPMSCQSLAPLFPPQHLAWTFLKTYLVISATSSTSISDPEPRPTSISESSSSDPEETCAALESDSSSCMPDPSIVMVWAFRVRPPLAVATELLFFFLYCALFV